MTLTSLNLPLIEYGYHPFKFHNRKAWIVFCAHIVILFLRLRISIKLPQSRKCNDVKILKTPLILVLLYALCITSNNDTTCDKMHEIMLHEKQQLEDRYTRLSAFLNIYRLIIKK